MSSRPLQVGVIGAGRVFQRLYGPAIDRIPGLQLVAVADPASDARERAGASIASYASSDDLIQARFCDAVIVLSPGQMHAAHAKLALAEGIPVLLEKPSAATTVELEDWPAAWRQLVSPARPRRYWPRYLALRRDLPKGATFGLVLQTSPAAWGSGHEVSPIDDLLPHLIDLAEWLSRSAVQAISGTAAGDHGAGHLRLVDGRAIAWKVGHPDNYEEYVTAGTRQYRLDTISIRERLVARLHGTPPADLLGVIRMLRLWERRLRGEAPPGLPGFETAARETLFREQIRSDMGT